jgi:hypothetical protein
VKKSYPVTTYFRFSKAGFDAQDKLTSRVIRSHSANYG